MTLAMAIKLLLAIFLCLVVYIAGNQQQTQEAQTTLREARQCRLRQIRAREPSQRIQSEGGEIELWDEYDEQFQCAGVAALRKRIQPRSLSLPNYSPSPRLVFIEKGRGLVGFSLPGCAETYTSAGAQSKGPRITDQQQKVHRFEQGDIIAVPAGAAAWYYNDGNEEVVAFAVTDLNNEANQLDQRQRYFNLAGGQPQQGQGQQQQYFSQMFQNVLRLFDENLLAEALNIPVQTVRKMQKDDNRGFIVKAEGGLGIVSPDEREGRDRIPLDSQGEPGSENGLEETYCNFRIRQRLDNPNEADIYSREAGRLHAVNEHKLPILRQLDMSAEHGRLNPNAILAPYWNMNAQTVVYVTRGDGRVQIIGPQGNTLLDDVVREGQLYVVPQYFPSTIKAGNNGFEWVSIKTSRNPMKSPLVGKNSVFKAMPLQVVTNSFQISNQEALNIKYNREDQTLLLPPSSRKT